MDLHRIEKGVLTILICFAVAMTFAQVLPASAKELRVGSWGGLTSDAHKQILVPLMKQKLPGVEIFIKEGPDKDREAKLRANPKNPELDVLYISSRVPKLLVEADMVEPPDPSKVPEYKDVYDEFKWTGGYPVWIITNGIAYNPEKVKKAPTSWFDLWNPEYKGRVAIPSPRATVNHMFIFGLAKFLGNGDERKGLAEVKKKLLELKGSISGYPTGSAMALKMFDTGDAWIAPLIDGYVFQAKYQKGQKIDFAKAKEGSVVLADSAVVPKHSPNKDSAYAWVRLQLSPEAQKSYAQLTYLGPTNKKAVLPDDLKDKVVYGPEQVKKLVNINWDIVEQEIPGFIEWWDKNMVK